MGGEGCIVHGYLGVSRGPGHGVDVTWRRLELRPLSQEGGEWKMEGDFPSPDVS